MALMVWMPGDGFSQARKVTVLRFILWGGEFVFILCHVIHNGSEVGGSIQLNCLEALVISLKNPIYTVTVRVLNVAILKETKQVHR